MNEAPAGTLSIEQLRDEQRRQWQQGVRVTAEALLASYPGFRTDPEPMTEQTLATAGRSIAQRHLRK